MSIEWRKDGIGIYCDDCGNFASYYIEEGEDIKVAISAAKQDWWEIIKGDEGWIHRCSNCAVTERIRSRGMRK